MLLSQVLIALAAYTAPMSRASTSEGSLVAFNTMLRQRQCSVSVTKLQAEAAPSALYCIVVSCHCLPASYCELLQHLHHCMKSDLGMVES